MTKAGHSKKALREYKRAEDRIAALKAQALQRSKEAESTK